MLYSHTFVFILAAPSTGHCVNMLNFINAFSLILMFPLLNRIHSLFDNTKIFYVTLNHIQIALSYFILSVTSHIMK